MEKLFVKEEIKKFLLHHERKDIFINRLTREIQLVELTNNIKLDAKKLRELTRDLCRYFANAALGEREKALKKSIFDGVKDDFGSIDVSEGDGWKDDNNILQFN